MEDEHYNGLGGSNEWNVQESIVLKTRKSVWARIVLDGVVQLYWQLRTYKLILEQINFKQRGSSGSQNKHEILGLAFFSILK